MSIRTIWTTQSVEATLEKYRSGMDVDLSFFHERNTQLKGRNVSFQLTSDEKEEFLRCSMDITYFVSKYCKFLTDKGQTTVDLHPYQSEILDLIGEEEFDEELEDFAPSVRNFILMAARQTGKCLLPVTDIYIRNKETKEKIKIPIGDFYEFIKYATQKPTLLSIIKKFLYKIYNKL